MEEATFSGYRFGENTGHVYRSTDNGTNWVDVTSNLPDIPVNDIEIDAFGNLFLATDIGVLSSLNQGDSWEPFGENLPSVVINDLHFDANSGFLFAGTYGRSSYKIDVSDNVLAVGDNFALSDIKFTLFPNPGTDIITIDYDGVEDVLEVYDQLGRKIRSVKIEGKSMQIDISDMTSGIYILKIGLQIQRLIKN